MKLEFRKLHLKLFARVFIALLIYGGVIVCTVYSMILSNEEKATYSTDVDYQYKRMHEYHIKPYSGNITNRLGGSYSADLKYAELSKEEVEALALDLQNDGFMEYPDSYKQGRKFCKNNIAVIIYYESAQVLITRYKEE